MNRCSVPHHLMVGILASSKTLDGKAPKKYPERYPKKEELANIFLPHPRTLNLVHLHSSEERLLDDMCTVHKLGVFVSEDRNQKCGFQINMTWPDPYLFEVYRTQWDSPEKRHIIVLQVGPRAMEEENNSSSRISRRITGYKSLVDYILLDYSGGEGRSFSWNSAYDMIQHIKVRSDHKIMVGVAGGLGPNMLTPIQTLGSMHPTLCIDAETGLMDPHGGGLDPRKVKLYLYQTHHHIFGIQK